METNIDLADHNIMREGIKCFEIDSSCRMVLNKALVLSPDGNHNILAENGNDIRLSKNIDVNN